MSVAPTHNAIGSQLPATDDADLMRRYVGANDPQAFAGLVRRHGPMVFGVCRRLLRDRHDAEDAFQATFLVLLKKASTVQPPQRVGNWLYGVACRTAAKANTMRMRRKKKENEAQSSAGWHSPEDQREMRSLLDTELARMPERYRAPIVLCELDGLSRREAAAALQLPEGTLSSRLSRARDLLRSRLKRRGLTLTAGALVAGLTAESAHAANSVPVPLLESIGRGVTSSTSLAGGAPDSVVALAQGVIKAMWISKIQTVATTTLLLCTIGSGAGVVTHHVIAKEKEKAAVKAAEKEGKDVKEVKGKEGKEGKEAAAPTVNTTVNAIDPTAHTITAHIPKPGEKTPPSTLDLARDVKVELAGPGKRSAPTAGKLSDVTVGTSVGLTLSPDQKTVTHIIVFGEHMNGTIKSVDAGARTVTIVAVSKSKEGDKSPTERKLAIHPDAQISFGGGNKTKGEPAPKAELSDLKEGQRVSVQILADRNSISSIMVEGKSVNGMVSKVDPSAKTITITGKGENGPNDQTFTVSSEAHIVVGDDKTAHSKLEDIKAGMGANLQFSARDPKTVTSIHAHQMDKPAKGEK